MELNILGSLQFRTTKMWCGYWPGLYGAIAVLLRCCFVRGHCVIPLLCRVSALGDGCRIFASCAVLRFKRGTALSSPKNNPPRGFPVVYCILQYASPLELHTVYSCLQAHAVVHRGSAYNILDVACWVT